MKFHESMIRVNGIDMIEFAASELNGNIPLLRHLIVVSGFEIIGKLQGLATPKKSDFY